MFKFGNIARQRFVQSNLVDSQISATVFMLKSDIVRSPGIDTSNYGAELFHSQEVGVSLQNPYSGNWSHYYDGSVSRGYTAVSNGLNLVLGSGNWTVEFWVRFYDTALDTVTRRVVSAGGTIDIATGWSIEVADQQYSVSGYTVPRGGLIFRNNTQILGTVQTIVNDGRWHHVAWSKVGATLYCYADGILQGSVVFAYNLSATGDVIVGRAINGQGAYEGYVSNVRITAGTGLYSGSPTITVPTSRLTTGTNTIMLFNHRAIFGVDESQYQQRVYRSGDPIWQKNIGPFADDPAIQSAISLVYPGQRVGYSVTLPDGRYRIGFSDFCVEFWFRPTLYASPTSYYKAMIFQMGDFNVYWYKAAVGDGLSWDYSPSNGTSGRDGPVTGSGDGVGGYTYQSWNHVVFSRSSGTITVHLNGVLQQRIFTPNINIIGTQYITVGNNSQGTTVNSIQGPTTSGGQSYSVNSSFMISDMRIVVGNGLVGSNGYNNGGLITSSTYIAIPTSPINNNPTWRGLNTASYIVYAGFAAQNNKNNRMPINSGYGYHPVMAGTFTNVNVAASVGQSRYDFADFGAQGTFTPFGTHGWSAFFTGTSVVATIPYQDGISLPVGKLASVNSSTGAALDLLRSYQSTSNTGNTNQTTGHDFTVECWFQCATVLTNNVIFNLNSGTAISQLLVYTTGTQMGLAMGASASLWAINTNTLGSTGTILPSVWYHLAVVKSSSTVRLYINGNDLTAPYFNPVTNTTGGLAFFNTWTGVTSYTNNAIGSLPPSLGPTPGAISSMTGFISNVRILQGFALYTGPFVPAVNRPLRLTQDQAYNQQRLYYPTDGTGASLGMYGATKGLGQTFSSGTSIMAVPSTVSTWNTSTWNTTTNTATFWSNLVVSTTATSDWTVECWIYPESFDTIAANNQNVPLVTLFGTGTNRAVLMLGLQMLANNVTLTPKIDIWNDTFSPSGWNNRLTVANQTHGWWAPLSVQSQVPLYRWSHLAATRQGGSWYVYLNGTQVLAISTGSTFAQNFQHVGQVAFATGGGVGGGGAGGSFYTQSFDSLFIGMISNVRVIQGQAIYTGTFTATNITFNTSTVGMVGPNIATTLTGLVTFLGAQDMYGGQGYIPGDGSFRRHMAVINSGTLVNGTTTTQHYAITERADNAAIFPRWMGPVGCMPSLLTLASKTFEDLSYNTQTVTKVQYSGVKLVPFAPFKTPTAHNPTVNGGSYYFNGQNALYNHGGYHQNLSTKDFTMETWFYLDTPLNNSKLNYLFDLGAPGTTTGVRMRIDATGQISLRNIADTALLQSPLPTAVHSGAWYHLAWTRRNGVGTGWLNGKSFGTYTDTTNYSDYRYYTSGWSLGNEVGFGSANGFLGYMASTRVVNDYAMYTTEFTPPTRAHGLTTNTFLLLNFNSYHIYDPSQKSNISVVGDIRTLYDESPYANAWSWSFDGASTGNFIATNNHDYVPIQGSGGSLQFGLNDFTFEGWFNILELQGRGQYQADTYHTIIDFQTQNDSTVYNGVTATNAQYFGVYIANSGTVIVGNGGGGIGYIGSVGNPNPGRVEAVQIPNAVLWGPANTATTMMVTVSSWTHIAVVRQTSTMKIFINGYNVAETNYPIHWNSTATDILMPGSGALDYIPRPVFGSRGYNIGSYYAYDGYMSNVRIVKGLAVYTTSSAGSTVQQFIPPTAPLTTTTTFGSNIQAVPGLGLYGSSQWFTTATVATTNYVATPVASGFDIVNSAFTIEGWAQYHLNTATYQTLFSLGTNAQNRISLYTTSTGYTLNFNAIVGGIHTINLTGPNIINTFTNGVVLTLPNPGIQIVQGQPVTVYAYTTSSTTNRWFHWAITKDAAGTAGTVRLFVNGQIYASGTSPSWFADGSNYMAMGFDPFTGTTATGHNLYGHLSNIRVTKGQALYLNTFTPPTSGYIGSSVGATGTNVPSVITGTVSLIALNTTTLRDLSANNYSLSSTGNTVVDNSFGPFGWAPALVLFNTNRLVNTGGNTATTIVNTINGGSPKASLNVPYTAYNTPLQLGNRSLFFTGGTQRNLGIDGGSGGGSRAAYIKVQDQPHHQFGEGPFTIELWFMVPYEYRANGTYRPTLMSKGGSNGADGGNAAYVSRGWCLFLESTVGSKVAFAWDNNIIRTTTTPTYGSWNHLVVQRENTGTQGLKIFMNGILEAAGTMPQTVNTWSWIAGVPQQTPQALLIGMSHNTNYAGYLQYDQFIGYMDDIRMTYGVARYANTTTITVPTAYNTER
jgi:Concanavalin A-like lectin/glucanases superfamily